MSEILICPVITGEEAEKAGGLLSEQVVSALKKEMPVTALAAIMDNMPVGAIAGFIDEEVFEIKSLFVDQEYRRQGVGRALYEKLEELVEEEDIAIRVQYTQENRDNETLLPFFKAMGFKVDNISYPSFYIGYLEDLNVDYKLAKKVDGRILSFSEVKRSVLNNASNVSLQAGYPVPEGGLTDLAIDRDLSYCIVKDDKVGAYITVEDLHDGLLEVPAVWSGLDNPMETLSMVVKLI